MLDIEPGGMWVTTRLSSNDRIAQEVETKSKHSTAAKPTVLVVDDERIIADTTVDILNRFGFEATRAYSGQQALKIVATLQPDYLLTDIVMPGMNGVELAIAINKMFPATKTVLFSGQAGISNLLKQAEEEGYAFELVAKPIHPTELIEFLKKL
jgi:CheY-like chemotaxis protein